MPVEKDLRVVVVLVRICSEEGDGGLAGGERQVLPLGPPRDRLKIAIEPLVNSIKIDIRFEDGDVVRETDGKFSKLRKVSDEEIEQDRRQY